MQCLALFCKGSYIIAIYDCFLFCAKCLPPIKHEVIYTLNICIPKFKITYINKKRSLGENKEFVLVGALCFKYITTKPDEFLYYSKA